MNEADRAATGKFAADKHTAQAREHVLAASIATNSNDMDEAGRRIDSAMIHTSHSQNANAPKAMASLQQAKDAHGTGNAHDIQRNLDTAYQHLQGLPNTLLKMKKVRESDPNKPLIETLTFFPKFIEGSYDPAARTFSVDIINEGLGNRRDKHFYTPEALRDAVKNGVFDGAQAYADHPSKFDDQNRPERSVRDLIGYYFDDQIIESQNGVTIRAKLKIQEGCDWALGLIKEAIDYNKKFPEKTYVGISINADGDTAPNERNGQQVNDVTKITEAFSADMVTKPARGGKFLQLVENRSGSHKGATVGLKLVDAATQIEKLAEGEEVDPAVLKSIAKEIRESEAAKKEAQGDVDDMSKKGSSNNKVGLDQMSEGQKTKWNAQFGEAKKSNWESMDESAKSKWMTDNADPAGSDGDQTESKKREAAAADAQNRLLEAAKQKALAEAAGGGEDELARLRRENAQLQAEKTMRESVALATAKLRESKIPPGAFKRTLSDMVGKSATEMDDIIRGTEEFIESVGGANSKASGAGGGSIPLRESEKSENTSLILLGLVED
jgi:hypothetical protein